jgi:hypothetical protein
LNSRWKSEIDSAPPLGGGNEEKKGISRLVISVCYNVFKVPVVLAGIRRKC